MQTFTLSFLGLSLVAWAVSGCGGGRSSTDDAQASDGTSEDEIVGGRATTERAVVGLDLDGEGACSGTLIAPRVVMTARHCVSYTPEAVDCSMKRQITGDRDPTTIGVSTGSSLPGTAVARGASLVVPAGTSLCEHDVAFIVLDRDVTGITPLSIATEAPTTGEKIRFVGYGRRGDDADYGQKRSRTVPIREVADAEIAVGEVTCSGDSGGPALSSTKRIVGVVSRGGPSCQGSDVTNIATRADVFADLAARAIARSDLDRSRERASP